MKFTTLLLVTFFVSCTCATSFLDLSDADILGLKLKSARTEVNRQALLNDSQYVFDFRGLSEASTDPANGGLRLKALTVDASNFPAVIGHGVAMTVAIVEPCGINLPHTHPRATEINFIVSGSLRIGFFQENGARYIGNQITAGMVTIFPLGSIHFEINDGCEPAFFVAAFNNEDPGVQTTTFSYFGLPSDVAGVGLGLNASQVQDLTLHLARDPEFGIEACLIRCGLSTSASTSASPSASTSASPSASTSASASSTSDSTSESTSSTSSTSTVGALTGSCSGDGSARCVTSETYQSCANGMWQSVQSCQMGLTCTPSETSIYCH